MENGRKIPRNMNKTTVTLEIRRYDLTEAGSEVPKGVKQLTINNTNVDDVKDNIKAQLGLCEDNIVLKLRNSDGVLVPYVSLFEDNSIEKPFILDVIHTHQTVSPTESNNALLQSAYVEAVRSKLENIEARVARIEELIPQLQWKRQVSIEQTAFKLGSRVSFLDQRINELAPQSWKKYLENGGKELPNDFKEVVMSN